MESTIIHDWSLIWLRRFAAPRPVGPAPMTRTSTSLCILVSRVEVATARIRSSHFLGHCDGCVKERIKGIKNNNGRATKEGITGEQRGKRVSVDWTFKSDCCVWQKGGESGDSQYLAAMDRVRLLARGPHLPQVSTFNKILAALDPPHHPNPDSLLIHHIPLCKQQHTVLKLTYSSFDSCSSVSQFSPVQLPIVASGIC